jgi:hypothetical protein
MNVSDLAVGTEKGPNPPIFKSGPDLQFEHVSVFRYFKSKFSVK